MQSLRLQQAKYDRLYYPCLRDGKAQRLEVERAEADLIIAEGRLANEQDQSKHLGTRSGSRAEVDRGSNDSIALRRGRG